MGIETKPGARTQHSASLLTAAPAPSQPQQLQLTHLGAKNTRCEIRASDTCGREDRGSLGKLAASHELAKPATRATTSWEGEEPRLRALWE